jgi:membrane protein YqaA with SNARE-associated domain
MDAGSAGLWGLATSAFLSSTLLPGGSEVVLAYFALERSHPAWLLLVVASAGNTLGGMSSWLIGRLIPAKPLERADLVAPVARIRKYGSPALLLSWVPVLGDPLCVAAGWLRIGWPWALLFIAVGKIARYAVLLMLVQGATQ